VINCSSVSDNSDHLDCRLKNPFFCLFLFIISQ